MILAATSLRLHVHTQVKSFHQIPIQYSLSACNPAGHAAIHSSTFYIRLHVDHKVFMCSIYHNTYICIVPKHV